MRHLGASVKDSNRNIKIGVNGEEMVMFEHSKTRKKKKKEHQKREYKNDVHWWHLD